MMQLENNDFITVVQCIFKITAGEQVIFMRCDCLTFVPLFILYTHTESKRRLNGGLQDCHMQSIPAVAVARLTLSVITHFKQQQLFNPYLLILSNSDLVRKSVCPSHYQILHVMHSFVVC